MNTPDNQVADEMFRIKNVIKNSKEAIQIFEDKLLEVTDERAKIHKMLTNGVTTDEDIGFVGITYLTEVFVNVSNNINQREKDMAKGTLWTPFVEQKWYDEIEDLEKQDLNLNKKIANLYREMVQMLANRLPTQRLL